VKTYLESHGATVTVLPGPEGDGANLFATIGPKDESGYIVFRAYGCRFGLRTDLDVDCGPREIGFLAGAPRI